MRLTPKAIISWQFILVFCGISYLVYNVLFGQKLFLADILNDQHTSALTIAYLKDLLAKEPDNMDYKISWAQQEFNLGRYEIAQIIVNRCLHARLQARTRAHLEILAYAILRSQTFALKPLSTGRKQAEKRLVKALFALQHNLFLAPKESRALGDDALAFNQPHLAIIFYKKLLGQSATLSWQWPQTRHHALAGQPRSNVLDTAFFVHAGKTALFISDYLASAHFYLQAMGSSSTDIDQKKYFMLALDSLKIGNLADDFTTLVAQNIGHFAYDSELLQHIISGALAINRPKLAQQYLDPLLTMPAAGNGDPSHSDHRVQRFIARDTVGQNNLYNLAYQVYLMNTNIQRAYAIAQAAVQQTRTNATLNQLWRNRLAQTALWSHNPLLAVKEYLYLARVSQDDQALTKGIALTKTMQDDQYLICFLKLMLHKQPLTPSIASAMIDAYLRLGEPALALQFLRQQRQQLPLSFYLTHKIKIYEIVGKLHNTLQNLQAYRQRVGINTSFILQEARILIANQQYQQAWQVMKATQHVVDKQYALKFWQTYANLANLTEHTQAEQMAYLHVLEFQPVAEEVYIRLVDLLGSQDPAAAYQLAKIGKHAYPTSIALSISSFSWSVQLDAWQDFPALDATTPAAVKTILKHERAYVEAKANYLQSNEQHEAALQYYFLALKKFLYDPFVKSDFLFFLITSNDTHRLAQVLPKWTQTPDFAEVLWGAIAEGYFVLANPKLSLAALQLFYDQYFQYQQDPYWLIGLKDILESTYHMSQSWAVTHAAWAQYLPLLQQQTTPADNQQLIDYIKLSLQEAPGELTQRALALLQLDRNANTELLSLTWAFNNHNLALADAIYLSYQLMHIVPPAWAVLSLALLHTDRQMIQTVLSDTSLKVSSTPKKITSYRDKIQAYQLIDDIAHAQQEAFEAQQIHLTDSDLYDHYLTPMMLQTAHRLYVSQEFYQYSIAEGPRNITALHVHPTPSVGLMPYHSIWFSNQLKSQGTTLVRGVAVSTELIQNIPRYDQSSGAQVTWAARRGSYILDAAQRNNLNTFATARLTRNYLLLQDLNTSLSLGYHQLADDSLGLLVGGMKNNALLSFSERLSSFDHLLGDFSYNALYTQSNLFVANNIRGTLSYEHHINLSYPDFSLATYATGGLYFDEVSTLSGSILTLIPPGVTPSAAFLIPSSFYEVGITGAFGQRLIDDYTHMWRPFGLLTISNNSTVGFGTLFNLGISGHVLGRDKLLLYFSQGTNQGTGIQLQRLAKISYSLYF